MVALILLNYNQHKYTIDCINSILKSTYKNFKIILVDNGSTKSEKNKLYSNIPKRVKINHVDLDKNQGYVGGINEGIIAANKLNPEYLMIMNNDTIIGENSIEHLVKCAEKYNGKAITTGKVYNYGSNDSLQYIGQKCIDRELLNYVPYIKNNNEKDVGQYDYEIEMDMIDDIFWLIPKNIIDKIGLYSDLFYLYGEQNDYVLRAQKHGFKMIYTPQASLWHKGGVTTCDGNKKSPKIEYWKSFGT